jgi:hypothetical protein
LASGAFVLLAFSFLIPYFLSGGWVKATRSVP